MENKPFRIGLCMAGAVSAGAYTAGVMDFLTEALEIWEQNRGNANVPSHRVTIPVMGGASAGGMTALLAASAINNPVTPIKLPERGKLLDEHPENKLYHSWVDLTGADMFPKLLSTTDISKGHVISLLNSQFIDEVAQKLLSADINQWKPTPVFFESPLKIFTTLSNLEGFHYNVDFNSGKRREKYNMSVHNDYACFEVSDRTDFKPSKGWMPLNFKTGENVSTARDAAMATGAFPVGLRARIVEREAESINEIPWLKSVFNNNPLPPGKHKSLHVDGGMINNEPFEKVRDLLDDITLESRDLKFASMEQRQEFLSQLNSNYNTFENTILMIDPFPSAEAKAFDYGYGLFSIIGKTLSAMTSQMRAKPINYQSAMQLVDAGQYIISPSRQIRDSSGNVVEELFGEKAIACGTLAGFGGFLNKEFRIHDYYLGRYNCEVFLRDYFTVPAEALEKHPTFHDGYRNANAEAFSSMATGEKRYQIIPIFSERPAKGYFPMPAFFGGTNWPAMDKKAVDRFSGPLRDRIQAVLLNLAELNWFTNSLVWIGAKVVLNRLLGNKVLDAIKKSLESWKLLR